MEFERESSSGALHIKKLFEYEYNVWKQKLDLAFSYREIDVAIYEDDVF